MMKLAKLIIFFAFTTLTAYSQVMMTDRNLSGLNGPIESVLEEYQQIRGLKGRNPDTERKMFSRSIFQKDGRLKEIVYSTSKVVFAEVDGFKTFRSIELESPRKDTLRTTSIVKEKPIETPEILSEPDERYDHRYVYEHDKTGRISKERQFLNTGRLFRMRTFQYNRNGQLTEEVEHTSTAIESSKYKYDRDGNLVEKLTSRNLKVPGTNSKSRTVYSDFKRDTHGNWIERKRTYYYSSEGDPTYNIPPDKWDVVYMEYRSITYH